MRLRVNENESLNVRIKADKNITVGEQHGTFSATVEKLPQINQIVPDELTIMVRLNPHTILEIKIGYWGNYASIEKD